MPALYLLLLRFTRAATPLLVSLALLAACAAPPPRPAVIPPGDYSYLRDYLSWRIPRDMRAHQVAGLSIALVDDQGVIWSAGFGYADVAAGVRATPQTVYRAASLSKLFTATAVMQRVDQGDIGLDRPLQAYVREFCVKTHYPDASPITLRQLLTHHSGLASFRFKGFWDAIPLSQLVAELQDEYAAYPPEYVYAYSNIGIDLLGRVLEVRSGQRFADYMEQALLRPLGMEQASFEFQERLRPLMSKGYRDGREFGEPVHGRDLPAGGLHASVADISRFMRMLLADGRWQGRQMLRAPTVAQMFQPQNGAASLDLDFRVGLGWQLGNGRLDYAGPVVSHSGATIVYRSRLILLPEQRLGVVVLSNSSTASPVVGDAAVEALRLALEIKTGLKPAPVQNPPPAQGGPVSAETLARFAGQYATKLGLVTIAAHDGRLSVRLQDRALRLVPHHADQFQLQYRVFGLIPINLGRWNRVLLTRADIAGHELLVATENGQAGQVGEKIHPRPIPDSWRRRLGDYALPEQSAHDMRIDSVRLYVRDGLLMLRYRIPEVSDVLLAMPLEAVSDSAAVMLGLGGDLGETVQVVTVAGEERLRFSGQVLQHLK